MLILTRKPGESLYIGDSIKVTIVEIKGHQIRVGIDAPQEFRIYREEIYKQIIEENLQAAEGVTGADALSGLPTGWQGQKPAGDDGNKKRRKLGVATALSAPQSKGAEPEIIIRKKR